MKRKLPRHIAIILDGNRRFAKRLMLQPEKGHELGAEKLEKLFGWCKEIGIKELTLYCLSLENLEKRPKRELNFLFNLFREEVKKLEKDERIIKDKIKINFIGRLYLLPKELQDSMNRIMEKTKKFNNYKIDFVIAYGGKTEIVDAFKKIAEKLKEGKLKIEKINENLISKNLYLSEEPDLIIRTGGEKRTSNFLPWQACYSEWCFLEKLWPEFSKEDLLKCIEEYSKRERKFGR